MKKLFGQEFWIKFTLRKSVTAPAPDAILFWGNSELTLDTQRMNPKLAKLMPVPLVKTAHTPEAWKPFVTLAVALRLL